MKHVPVTILLPALLGSAVLAMRESTRPPQPDAGPAIGPIGVLPDLRTIADPADGSEFEIDPSQSTARFEVDGLRGLDSASCPVRGRLRWSKREETGQLELRLDLRALRVTSGNQDIVWSLLGIRSDSDVAFHARCTQALRPAPGVQRATFDGRWELGSDVWRQELEFWSSYLVPGRLRLIGVGVVRPGGVTLPQRYLFGVLPDSNQIWLALDLAFLPAERH